MLLKLAWRNIWRNKRRSIITATSVTFALFFAILMRSMQNGTYDNVYYNVINSSTGYVQVHGKDFWDKRTLEQSMAESDSLTSKLQHTKEVKDLVPRLESFSLLSTGNNTKGAMIMGIDPKLENQYFNLKKHLYAGRIFNLNDHTIMLAKGLADYFNVKTGDTIIMIGQGYHGISANGKYVISGILQLNSPELNKQLAYLPLPEAQQLFGMNGRITSMVVVPADADDFHEIADRIQAKLDTSKYEVMTWREMMPELINAMQADSQGGLVILFILYLVIGFGVFGTILMLTAERLPEFGILISIGMSRGKIALITFLETVFLAIIGILAGWALTLPITHYFHAHPIKLSGQMDAAMQQYGMEPIIPASIDWSIPLWHSLSVLIVTMILSLYAIWKIYTLNPLTAMKR